MPARRSSAHRAAIHPAAEAAGSTCAPGSYIFKPSRTNSCHVCRAAAKKSVTSQGAICKLGPLRHSPPVSMTAGRAPSIISPSCCLLAEALRRTDNACKHILDSLAACALGCRRNEPGMPAATLLSRHCRRPDLKPGSGSPCPFTASLSLVDKRVHLYCLYWYCTFMMLGG